MPLGLFNWTSDLSDEPEYPPFFDYLRMSDDDEIGAEEITNARGNCIIRLDGGGGFYSTDIGGLEYLQDGGEGFGWESGVYLVLNQPFMSSWETPYIASADLQYQRDAYWSRFKPAVKENFEKDPDAWCLATTGFTPKQIRDNFVFWDAEECYVCLNPDWNTKAQVFLRDNYLPRWRKFNNCIRSKLDAGERVKNTLDRLDAALNRIGSSLYK